MTVPHGTAVRSDRRALLDSLASHRVPVTEWDLPGRPRLLVSPRPASGVIGVAVGAPAGFRTEAPGEEGLAHLLEHLMFRSGAEDGGFVHQVHRRGGTTNASTHLDHTLYWQELPHHALEEALRDEADRFLRPLITPGAVARQREIVLEEIASNVDNQPLGGFPWARLPAVAFGDHANRHNGYGTAESLAVATAESARSFFDRFYHPRRLTVAVVGDTDPATVRDLMLRVWPASRRPLPPHPALAPAEFLPGRYTGTDPFVTSPAVAIGWPAPPAETAAREHAAAMLLADMLGGGSESRLHARLVLDTGVARMTSCYVGFNDPLQCRSPMLLVAEAHLARGADPDRAVALVKEAVGELAAGVDDDSLAGTALFSLIAYWRSLEGSTGQARALAAHGVLRGSSGGLFAHPALASGIEADDVRRCAARILATEPAVLVVEPGAPEEPGKAEEGGHRS
ncbi:M16 family metallopeptidase [Streptomyces sp. 8N706]|uniref:M16 family metallopeptidase n=1 Tax=Streptomyces sp. 8N706 TaxID=3457416 RepID=UPI003FD62F80